MHCRLVGHLFFKLRFFLVGTYCCLLCAHCVRLVLSSPPNADGDCFQFGTPSAGITWTGNNITINTTRYNIILLLYCLRFSSSANVYVDFSYLENSCLRAFCLFYPLFTLGYVSFLWRELVDLITASAVLQSCHESRSCVHWPHPGQGQWLCVVQSIRNYCYIVIGLHTYIIQ